MMKRYLFLLLLVGGFGLGLSPVAAQKKAKGKPAEAPAVPTVMDVWGKYTFMTAPPTGIEWTEDGRMYQLSESGDLVRYSAETGDATDTLLPARHIPQVKGKPIELESYTLSPDGRWLLVTTETQSIYRWSSKYKAFVIDLKGDGKGRKPFTYKAVEQEGLVSNFTFSPGSSGYCAYTTQDGSLHVHSVNSLVYLKSPDQVFESAFEGQTIGGNVGEMANGLTNMQKGMAIDPENADIYMSYQPKTPYLNGYSDWVYEEEFELVRAYEWSPDGRYVAFLQFDEENVPEFSMDVYGDSLYPSQHRFRYPKAGATNSTLRLYIYDVPNRGVIRALKNLPEDSYLPRIYWPKGYDWPRGHGALALWMNRDQNELKLYEVNPITGEGTVVLEEKTNTYIELNENKLLFTANGQQFVWQSERDGFNHLYLYDFANDKPATLVRQLTTGKWDVTAVHGCDVEKGLIYFQSAQQTPIQRQEYVLNVQSGEVKTLAGKPGWNEASFSPNFRYYILEHSAANQVPRISLHKSDGTELRVLEENLKLQQVRAKYLLLPKTFLTVPGADGTPLNAWMIRPPKTKKGQKHPVLMFVYGGPGHQTVRDAYDRFDYYWYQVLANAGYIIVSVDGRGTGARGADFKKSTYLNLGKLEMEDQVAAARYLKTLADVDATRVGIWGWSFGGYLTALCLTKAPDEFKAGISVAPVTHWKFYDSIYTERFLRRPKDNPKGYEENSPLNYARNLKARFLLVHGTGDDNVHVQNAMVLTKALVKYNRPFEQFMYPDRNHGIYGGATRLHLYEKMTRFLLENL